MRKEQILAQGKKSTLTWTVFSQHLKKIQIQIQQKFHEFECYNQPADKVWEHRLKC